MFIKLYAMLGGWISFWSHPYFFAFFAFFNYYIDYVYFYFNKTDMFIDKKKILQIHVYLNFN